MAELIAEDAATLVAGHLESEDKMKFIIIQMHQLKLQRLSLIKTKNIPLEEALPSQA